MKYDYSKLEGIITEVFGTQGIFADAIGLSEEIVSKKLNNKAKWKQEQIDKACEVLGIDRKLIGVYFFTPLVQQVEHLET